MEQQELFNLLRRVRYFASVSDVDLTSVMRYGNYRCYRRGKTLCYQSEPVDFVFLILSGRIVRLKNRVDGSVTSIGNAESGDWLGLAESLLNCPYLYDAETTMETDALVFSTRSFREVAKISSMKDVFVEYLAKSVYTLHSQIELNAPYYRLIQYILANSPKMIGDESNKTLKATQDEIAQFIGTTRETVNKYLQELQRKGLILVNRGSIDILELDALQVEIEIY